MPVRVSVSSSTEVHVENRRWNVRFTTVEIPSLMGICTYFEELKRLRPRSLSGIGLSAVTGEMSLSKKGNSWRTK